jgi:platelet-activating factor acetylhydrolase
MFKDKLDVQDPGKLIWSGHSFGAATMIQFAKSICYTPPTNSKPLFIPELDTAPDGALPLRKQVTSSSPILLLDPWCLPLLGRRTSHLFKHPLPQISANKPHLVLAIMSEEFFRWKENLIGVKRILSPDPGRKRGGARNELFEKWDSSEDVRDAAAMTMKNSHHQPHPPRHDVPSPMSSIEDENDPGRQIIPPTATPSPTPLHNGGPHHHHLHHRARGEPRFYYAKKSAHLSQSDFGILFPRVIRKAENPSRILELNVRAVMQWLRECGYSQRVAQSQELEGRMEGLGISDKGDDDADKGDDDDDNGEDESQDATTTAGWDWSIFRDGDEILDGWGRIELEEFGQDEEDEHEGGGGRESG